MMKLIHNRSSFFNICAVGVMGLLLTACESIPWPLEDQQNNQQSVMMSGPPDSVQTGPVLSPLSTSSVAVFDLSADPSMIVTQPVSGAQQQIPASVRALPSSTPNVQVFSLDDVAAPLPSPHQSMIPLPPISPSGFNSSSVQQTYNAPQDMYSAPARIYFGHGSSSLDADDKIVLEQISRNYRSANSGLLSIEGHASQRAEVSDPVLRKITNLKMSMNRALAVSSSLIKMGVSPESITTKAWGESRPAQSFGDYSQEAASRRVEILASSQ